MNLFRERINKNVYSNDGIRKILGYSLEEIRELGTQLISTLMHPDDLKVYVGEILQQYRNTKDDESINSEASEDQGDVPSDDNTVMEGV